MKAYIQKGFDNEFITTNAFIAFDGFRQMGWEIIPFQKISELIDNEPANLVMGGIDEVKEALQMLKIPIPAEINYPEELQGFLGRKIWQSSINTIAANPQKWNVFVKPIHAAKKFTGVVVNSAKDLIGCGDQFQDTPIWCSEVVNFVAEWRCFVRYGEILDVRPYRGNWRKHFDYQLIESALKAYTSAPKAFAMDFGLTTQGKTLLIEVNDGYSLGSYGLTSIQYAKLLSARWAEITDSRDYCDF
ncbi:MAG: ATP-grasp domain-containing protein [Microscillaceae bacterium]|jgi:hypothetical protein|nr:ATP-grasp domain-containing protein [Microscillaceae bacterium]